MRLRERGATLIVQTPAKLNLFLEILRRRSDGYHDLETVMLSVGLFDTLRFREETTGRIEVNCFDAGAGWRADGEPDGRLLGGRDNLVVQAASLLRASTGTQRGVRVDVFKRIPAAAGLAGGSSDAAATLVALNRLWGLNLHRSQLQTLASQLGSDVAFFLTGASAALCRGRGEPVERIRLSRPLYFVIVRPPHGLSTAVVFAHCRPTPQPRSAKPLLDDLRHGRLARIAKGLYNALAEPAAELEPTLTDVRTVLAQQPVMGQLMSGSGSAHFGLCATRRQALRVAARLHSAGIGRVFVARSC